MYNNKHHEEKKMKQELRNYLKKIEEKNKYTYFVLWSFYLNPSNTLNDNIIIKNFHNKDFLYFLKLCLKDEVMKKRLNDQDLKNIHYQLFNIKEEWEEYFNKKLNNKQKITKKDLNIITKEFNNKNNYFFLLNNLIKNVVKLEEQYCENNILPKIEKERILNKIINDDYQNNTYECFLFNRHGKDTISIDYLICDNDFLNIVENYLLKYELPYIIIYNIIEILQISIRIKTYKNTKLKETNPKLDNKVRKYNYKKSLELIKKLEKKEGIDNKIIPFNIRRIKI